MPREALGAVDSGPRITDRKVADYVRLLEQKLRRVTSDRDRLSNGLRTLDPVAFDRLMSAQGTAQPQANQATQHQPLQQHPIRDAATSILRRDNLERLGLEFAEVDEQLVIRSRFQRWILLWQPELTALAEAAGLSEDDLHKMKR